MRINNADNTHIEDCLEAVINSPLGEVYYSDHQLTRIKFREAITARQLFVAVEQEEVLGYAWIVPRGMFDKFPYLRSIAIKQEHRGKGIGKALLSFFESQALQEADQVYLLVSSFNPDAKRLYQSLGYKQVGELKDWVLSGIDEYLMLKKLI